VAPADPRPQVKMTLEDCVRLALDNNLDLLSQRIEPETFEGDLVSFKGAWDPVVYASGSRRASRTPTASALSGAPVASDQAWVAALGVRGVLLTGTSWDFSFESERADTNNSYSTLNPRWNSSFGFSLRQPLLRNAWLDYNLINARLSRNSHRGSVSRVEQSTAETIYAVELAYWNLINAIRQKNVKDRALELAQRLYEVNRNKVRAGALAPIEELRAESEVASQKEGIILAQNAIEDAQDALRRLIRPFSKPSDWDFVITPTDDPAFEPRAVDLNAAIADALSGRPELEELRLSIDSAKLRETKYSREMLPSLDLTGNLRWVGLGGNMGDSLEGINSDDYDTWEIGVIFEYPLGSRTAKGGLIRAEADRRRADLALRNLEQDVVVEVRQAGREINSSRERIEATRTASRLAKRALEAEQARYDRGLTTSHDLLQFQKAVTDAESNETQAVVDYMIGTLKLRKATGAILRERAAAK